MPDLTPHQPPPLDISNTQKIAHQGFKFEYYLPTKAFWKVFCKFISALQQMFFMTTTVWCFEFNVNIIKTLRL